MERHFVVQTNASDGIGALLSQRGEDDVERLVAYFDCKLLPKERNYVTMVKTVVEGIYHFQVE